MKDQVYFFFICFITFYCYFGVSLSNSGFVFLNSISAFLFTKLSYYSVIVADDRKHGASTTT